MTEIGKLLEPIELDDDEIAAVSGGATFTGGNNSFNNSNLQLSGTNSTYSGNFNGNF